MRILQKKQTFSDDDSMNKYLDLYYLISTLSDSYELIKMSDIISKCSILYNNEEIFVNRCSYLTEHD